MKNIFAKVAASILFVALIFSLPAAAQELSSDTQRKAHSLRSTPRKVSDITVHCGSDSNNNISKRLAKLNPAKPHTIRVSGTCNENLDIVGFQHLILITEDGASLTDASGEGFPVVNVLYTTLFEMLGFTINGGVVVCGASSNCFFADNTFQNSPDAGAYVYQSKADFIGGVMQNNGSQGLLVQDGSTVSIVGVSLLNNSTGANVGFGSTLIAYDSTAQDNASDGFRASANSTLRLFGNTVSGSGRNGVLAYLASIAFFNGGNTVSNNAQGVRIGDLSMGVFLGEDITGNLGEFDVLCEPQFPATDFVLTNINGGTTNCVEP